MWGRAVRWILYIIPILAFVVLLNAGQVLKRPMGSDDDVLGSLSAVEQAVLAGEWSGAGAAWERAQSAMARVERRLGIDAEKGQLQDFGEELARLRGSIQAQERGAALASISVLKSLFDELGR